MLYTRIGDNGTTRDFDPKNKNRISKSSYQMEALGALDELNSFLGLLKLRFIDKDWFVGDKSLFDIIRWVQNNLFIIQAKLAGANKKIDKIKILEMEKWINDIEGQLSPIKTFFISGGTEIATISDISRTLARKAERRVVKSMEEGNKNVDDNTLAFLNRLSSLLYAVARLSNHKSGIKEESPEY